jgi:hypothetical protein
MGRADIRIFHGQLGGPPEVGAEHRLITCLRV